MNPEAEPRLSPLTQRATGPRTPQGKERSKHNAVKHAIFSRALLLRSESSAEYRSLLKGLREEWQPQGTLETVLVENLAVLLWRKRRLLQAEAAEIAQVADFLAVDSALAQQLEAEDHARDGETTGGLLKHRPNPFVLENAISIPEMFRLLVQQTGFRYEKDPWILRKLYGLDHDDAAPLVPFHQFMSLAKRAARAAKGEEGSLSPDEVKNETVEAIEEELRQLKKLQETINLHEARRIRCKISAAVVPGSDVLDRLVRYEAHLSREFDRTLNQLERLQRMRQGQPVPPPIKVQVSD